MRDLKQIHIKLTPELHKALKIEAAFCDATIQELIVELIQDRLKKSKAPYRVREQKND